MTSLPFSARHTALALAAMAALGAMPTAVQALGLGRLSVQSALGEGMRAEIDITSLTPEEDATLQVRLAPPDAYRAAGVDYNAVLAGARVGVVRRSDGRAILRLSSERAVQEPFVEVIVELTSSSGRLVREYTLLFDPPGNRVAPPVQAAAPVAPVISVAPAATSQGVPPAAQVPATPLPRAAAASVPRPAARPAPEPPMAQAPAPAPQAPRPRPAPRPADASPSPATAAAPAGPATASGQRYQVRAGDTLYRVAGRTQQPGISLDQMLVGLYRANPDAFIDRNVNKLRAGSQLAVPLADEMRDISAGDARRLLAAQSLDFGAYRERLAQAAPPVATGDGARAAQGKVQAAVDDRKQATTPPDKLKLTEPTVKPGTPEPPKDPAKDNATRVAELTRNVEELKKLQQGAAAAQGPAAAPAAAPAPAPAPVPAPVASPPPAPSPAPAPAAASPAPTASPAGVAGGTGMAAAPAVPMPQAPAVEPPAAGGGLLDSLGNASWLPYAGGALVLALGGLAAWQFRGRFRKTASETSFLESRMQPDSFFGASGGQRVDTRDGPASNASSMGYSLSQLDAIGDVDPVAEADVYLAYGRDLQAEEILKEAMRATPDRLAVRTKLLEVYAKRRDTKGFELLATQLYALTKGVGADWAQAQSLGLQIDPENQLYQPGGHPEEIILDGERVVVEPLSATTQPHSLMSTTTPGALDSNFGASNFGSSDLDLDLNLDLPDGGLGNQPMEATRPMAPNLHSPSEMGLPFEQEMPRTVPVKAPRTAQLARSPSAPSPASPPSIIPDLDLDSLTMDLDDGRGSSAPTQPAAMTTRSTDSMFDLVDFDRTEAGPMIETTRPNALDDGTISADPLARKLELAEEFRQIGDLEGARDLLEEVVAKAGGTLRAKAQAMLDALG